MTQSAIVSKLDRLLAHGVRSEAEAAYLMVEVRKLLEQQDARRKYQYLTFHCDWALHAKLNGPTAQRILKLFDAASPHLKAKVELHQLPGLLQTEIDRISKLSYFEQQLETFLKNNGLPTLRSTRADGWIHFIHFYAQIVEDCPFVMTAKDSAATVACVTLQMESATRVKHGEVFFKVTWVIQEKNGSCGEIFVVNSFSSNSRGRHSDVARSFVRNSNSASNLP